MIMPVRKILIMRSKKDKVLEMISTLASEEFFRFVSVAIMNNICKKGIFDKISWL